MTDDTTTPDGAEFLEALDRTLDAPAAPVEDPLLAFASLLGDRMPDADPAARERALAAARPAPIRRGPLLALAATLLIAVLGVAAALTWLAPDRPGTHPVVVDTDDTDNPDNGTGSDIAELPPLVTTHEPAAVVLHASGLARVRFTADGDWHAARRGDVLGDGVEVRLGRRAGALRLLGHDGSRLSLSRGATLRRETHRRWRLLAGSVAVDVAKSDTPLTVATADGDAVALGTRFQVRIDDDRKTRVDVEHGQVALRRDGQAQAQVLLGAGQAGQFAGQAVAARVAVDPGAWRWVADVAAAARREQALGSLLAKALDAAGPQRRLPMELLEHRVRTVIDGPLAVTHVTETFRNTTHRRLEGMFRYAIPDDARVTELALWVGQKREVGEVVERGQARRVYEYIRRQRRDPALLERTAGGRLQLRVFPIEPRQTRKVELTYVQRLARVGDRTRYRVPLVDEALLAQPPKAVDIAVELRDPAGLADVTPSHGDLTLDKHSATLRYRLEGQPPTRDLVLDWRLASAPAAARVWAERDGDGPHGWALIELTTPRAPRSKTATKRPLVLVVDGSASVSLADHKRAAETAAALVELATDAGRPVSVAHCADDVRVLLPSTTDTDAADRVARALADITPRGASDLIGALATLKTTADTEIVYLGDGQHTADQRTVDRARVTGALWAICPPQLAAVAELRRLTRRCRGGLLRPRAGADPSAVALDLFARLGRAPHQPSLTAAKGSPLADLLPLPTTTADAAPCFVGRITGPGDAAVTLDGTVVEIVLDKARSHAAPGALWGALRCDGLESEIARLTGIADRARERQQLIDLQIEIARRLRVLTDRTAWLVLENESEYDRYGIGRAKKASARDFGQASAESSGQASGQKAQAKGDPRMDKDRGQMRGASAGGEREMAGRKAFRQAGPGPGRDGRFTGRARESRLEYVPHQQYPVAHRPLRFPLTDLPFAVDATLEPVAVYQRRVRRAPKDLMARLHLAMALGQQRPRAALQALAPVRAAYPKLAPLMLLEACLLRFASRPDEATDRLREALALLPAEKRAQAIASIAQIVYLPNAFMVLGNEQVTAARNAPDAVTARKRGVLAATLHRHAGTTVYSERMWLALAERWPTDGALLHAAGADFQTNGRNHATAATLFRAALRAGHASGGQLARALEQAGRLDAARAQLARTLAGSRDATQLHWAYGVASRIQPKAIAPALTRALGKDAPRVARVAALRWILSTNLHRGLLARVDADGLRRDALGARDATDAWATAQALVQLALQRGDARLAGVLWKAPRPGAAQTYAVSALEQLAASAPGLVSQAAAALLDGVVTHVGLRRRLQAVRWTGLATMDEAATARAAALATVRHAPREEAWAGLVWLAKRNGSDDVVAWREAVRTLGRRFPADGERAELAIQQNNLRHFYGYGMTRQRVLRILAAFPASLTAASLLADMEGATPRALRALWGALEAHARLPKSPRPTRTAATSGLMLHSQRGWHAHVPGRWSGRGRGRGYYQQIVGTPDGVRYRLAQLSATLGGQVYDDFLRRARALRKTEDADRKPWSTAIVQAMRMAGDLTALTETVGTWSLREPHDPTWVRQLAASYRQANKHASARDALTRYTRGLDAKTIAGPLNDPQVLLEQSRAARAAKDAAGAKAAILRLVDAYAEEPTLAGPFMNQVWQRQLIDDVDACEALAAREPWRSQGTALRTAASLALRIDRPRGLALAFRAMKQSPAWGLNTLANTASNQPALRAPIARALKTLAREVEPTPGRHGADQRLAVALLRCQLLRLDKAKRPRYLDAVARAKGMAEHSDASNPLRYRTLTTLVEAGQLDQAVRTLALVNIDATPAEVFNNHYQLATNLQQHRKLRRAIAVCTAGIAKFGEQAHWLRMLRRQRRNLYSQAGDRDRALAEARWLVDHPSGPHHGYLANDVQQLLTMLQQQRKLDALRLRLVALQKGNPQATAQYGWILQNQWQWLLSQRRGIEAAEIALDYWRGTRGTQYGGHALGQLMVKLNALGKSLGEPLRKDVARAIEPLIRRGLAAPHTIHASQLMRIMGHLDRLGLREAFEREARAIEAGSDPRRIAQLALLRPDQDRRIALLERAVALPGCPRQHWTHLYNTYVARKRAGDIDRALRCVEKIIAGGPAHRAQLRFQALIAGGRKQAATAAGRDWLKHAAGFQGAQNVAQWGANHGLHALALDGWAEATRRWRDAGAPQGFAYTLYHGQAEALRQLGRTEQALDALLRGMSVASKPHGEYEMLANAVVQHLLQGDIERIAANAEAVFERTGADKPQLRLALARAYAKQGKVEEQLTQLEAAAALMPADDALWTQVIDGWIGRKQWQQAKRAADAWVAHRPRHPRSWRALARVHTAHQHRARALEAWRSMVDVRPGSAAVCAEAAKASVALDDRDGAVGLYRRAISIRPARFDLSAPLAALLPESDRRAVWQAGEAACRAAIARFADDPRPWLDRAQFLAKLGKTAEAKTLLKEILQRPWPRFRGETRNEAYRHLRRLR